MLIFVCEVLPSSEACYCEKVPGRRPKHYSPVPGHLGAPCQWRRCSSLRYKEMNRSKLFRNHFMVGKLNSVFFKIPKKSLLQTVLNVKTCPLFNLEPVEQRDLFRSSDPDGCLDETQVAKTKYQEL